MRNKFTDKCFKCGKEVKSGEGFFQKVNKGDGKLALLGKKWVVRCENCVGTGNQLGTQ